MSESAGSLLRLNAVARGDRDETTARVRDAFGGAGAWIVDVHFFSGVQTTFAFEIRSECVVSLERALRVAGLVFDEPSLEALRRVRSAGQDLQGTLAVTFAHGDPDLKHEVPAVPG